MAAARGLPRYPSKLQDGNPLLEGMQRNGTVEMCEGAGVEVGATFVWFWAGGGKRRELMRVIAAAPADGLPARMVLQYGRHELVAFWSEVEVWRPPTERSPHAAARLGQLVGDPLR